MEELLCDGASLLEDANKSAAAKDTLAAFCRTGASFSGALNTLLAKAAGYPEAQKKLAEVRADIVEAEEQLQAGRAQQAALSQQIAAKQQRLQQLQASKAARAEKAASHEQALAVILAQSDAVKASAKVEADTTGMKVAALRERAAEATAATQAATNRAGEVTRSLAETDAALAAMTASIAQLNLVAAPAEAAMQAATEAAGKEEAGLAEVQTKLGALKSKAASDQAVLEAAIQKEKGDIVACKERSSAALAQTAALEAQLQGVNKRLADVVAEDRKSSVTAYRAAFADAIALPDNLIPAAFHLSTGMAASFLGAVAQLPSDAFATLTSTSAVTLGKLDDGIASLVRVKKEVSALVSGRGGGGREEGMAEHARRCTTSPHPPSPPLPDRRH